MVTINTRNEKKGPRGIERTPKRKPHCLLMTNLGAPWPSLFWFAPLLLLPKAGQLGRRAATATRLDASVRPASHRGAILSIHQADSSLGIAPTFPSSATPPPCLETTGPPPPVSARRHQGTHSSLSCRRGIDVSRLHHWPTLPPSLPLPVERRHLPERERQRGPDSDAVPLLTRYPQRDLDILLGPLQVSHP